MNKYELTDETRQVAGHTLHRIRAVRTFSGVNKGALGGWIESEDNLSQKRSCWVYDEACVYGGAQVSDRAKVYGNALVYGDALVYDHAKVSGNATVDDHAQVFEEACVSGYVLVSEHAQVHGGACVSQFATIADDAEVCQRAYVSGLARVGGNAEVLGGARVHGEAEVCDDAHVCGSAIVCGNACIAGDARLSCPCDYMVFRNTWSSGRWITYTRSNRMWCAGCFRGTGEELIKKAYEDDRRKGKCYEATVRYVEQIEAIMAEERKEKS